MVCNDTTALGIGAINLKPNFNWENTVTGVVGTGFNFGFFEKENLFINLESGNFNKFSHTASAKFIDSESNEPGYQMLEKEVGGVYLNRHFNYYAKEMGLSTILKDGAEVSQTAKSGDNKEAVLARDLITRSASLVASHIAGLYDLKKEMGMGSDQMLCALEGSLYWRGYGFKEVVNLVLSELGYENKIIIEGSDDLSLIGAANLV